MAAQIFRTFIFPSLINFACFIHLVSGNSSVIRRWPNANSLLDQYYIVYSVTFRYL